MQRRLLVPLVIVLLLLVGGFSFVLMRSYKTNLDQTSAQVLKDVSDELAKEMVEQSEGLAALEEVFLRDASLHYAMKDRDRERLLTSYGDVFAQLRQDHGMTHFYFHGPDRVNLLRVHKPEKHGDLIDRFTAREAERTGKMAFGIELGPLGNFTLRVVRPVFDGGTLIGYIELGKEIEDILAGIHDKHGVELALDIRKRVLDRTKWEAGMKMLGREADWDRFPDDVLIYTSMPRFPSECEQYVGEAGLTYDDVTAEAEFNDKSWRVMANPLKDASGAGVGDLIVMDDISEAKSAFNRLVAVAIGVALLLVTALIGFLYVVLRHTDQGIYKQQEALRESEEKYRTILESIEDGYFEVDLPGNLTFFNDALCKITGFSREKIMGINNRDYMDEKTAKKVYETYAGIYETGEPVKGYDYEIRKDGIEKHVETSVSLRKDAKGQPIGFMGVLRDVTERKMMEAELIQTKDFLQNILDSSIDGITSTDLEGNIIYFSSRAGDIIGYEREELAGKKASLHYENGVEDAKKIMKELKEKGELIDYEMRFRKKDGGLIDINLSGSYLKNEKGAIIGTLGIYRDISDKKLLETQLQHAKKMESIGTLAGGIAHNFNNLLMGIQGNASMVLLDIDSSHPRHKNLKSIEKLVDNGAKLSAQLIGYAREGKYEVKPISLNQLVKETSGTFGMTKREITVHQELSERLYGIEADQGQIEQALLNLYLNAADAMPGGGDLFLKTMNVTDKNMTGKLYKAKPGNYVLLTVRDTGIGMDKETRERIFEPFFTTKGLASGTGLGTASAYGTIKGHGGYIDVDSEKGKGTTFSIYLPATEKMIEEKKVSSDELVKGKGTVLLVDDEEMVLEAGKELLGSWTKIIIPNNRFYCHHPGQFCHS